MIYPERMFLVTVLAAREHLPRLVHLLHTLGRVHLMDAIEGEGDDFLRPAPPQVYFPVEGHLVALRGIKDYLGISPPPHFAKMHEAELIATLPERLEMLDAEVRSRRERLEALRSEEQNIRSELALLAPLAGLPVRLDLLGDYETFEALAIAMATPDAILPADLPVAEVAEARQRHKTVKFLIAEKKHSEVLRAFVAQKNAEALVLPRERPARTPDEQRLHLLRRLAEIEEARRRLDGELAKIAADNRLFICAAEEALLALLEKNHGASYFAASAYALAGRFWVAESDLEWVKNAILRRFNEGVEIAVEEAPAVEAEEKDIPPTRLRNRSPVKPFEGLVEMLSMPAYHEIDPTSLLAICFPVFFGFIIGDVGYGLALVALGLYLRARFGRANRELADMLYCLTVGGASAALFGLLVFGDCFGLPFHSEPGCAFSWHEWLPFLPHPLIVKTSSRGVDEMLALSFCAGWLHMGIGCLLGVWNGRHSLRHLLGRLGQMLLVMAMAIIVLALETFRLTAVGGWLWRNLLTGVESVGMANTVAGLLAVGLALSMAGEGIKAAFEIFGLLSNVVSFSRLALVAVSKATLVGALNDFLVPALHKNSWAISALAIAMLGIGHFVMLALGALSGSIQSLRLHYYETFSKFFAGNGKKFVAFGMKRAYTDA